MPVFHDLRLAVNLQRQAERPGRRQPATCRARDRAPRRDPDHGRGDAGLPAQPPVPAALLARTCWRRSPTSPGRRLLRRRRPLHSRRCVGGLGIFNSSRPPQPRPALPRRPDVSTATAPSASTQLQRLPPLPGRRHHSRRRQQPVLAFAGRRASSAGHGRPASPADCNRQRRAPGPMRRIALICAGRAAGGAADRPARDRLERPSGHLQGPGDLRQRLLRRPRRGGPGRRGERSALSSPSTSPATTRSPATRAGPTPSRARPWWS